MTVRALGPADYRRVRWKNDGGWTTELAVHPRDDADGSFAWRISIAEIETSGPFSTFPGCDRHIALLEGVGMELRFDGAAARRLDRRLAFETFAGEWKTDGVLIAGPVRDFNVIVRRDACTAEVLHRPLVGPMVFFPDAAFWFIHLVGGRAEARVDDTRFLLEAGMSLQIDAPRPGRVILSGGGELILVKLSPAGAS